MEQITFNRTKIIATVGPASDTKQKLADLIKAGADVFRLNFSHGSHEDHLSVIKYVRELNEEMNTSICILQDLQGPKIRTEAVEKGTRIKEGKKLTITTSELEGNSKIISTTYKNLPNDVKVGDTILIDDGKIELYVESVEGNEVQTLVVYGGKLKSRKGINLPDSDVSAPSMTKKDIVDLDFGLKHNVEWVALSFVRKASDITDLRKRIESAGKETLIIAKIEKPEAVRDIDQIIEVSDGIMVARGDLGVEMKSEEVPMIQKEIVAKCRLAAKPVIIATQMMESMIENPRPTRAETNDIANAVMDGADTIMLSAETAAGAYPVPAVRSMVKTIKSVETKGDVFSKLYSQDESSEYFLNDSVLLMAARIARNTNAKAIVGLTKRGYTAFKISSFRPRSSIFIFTSNKPFINTMNLLWGVRGFYYDSSKSTDSTIKDLDDLLKENGFLKKGDITVNLAAMPINLPGRVNTLKLNQVS